MNRRLHAKNTLNILAYYQRKDALMAHKTRFLNDWAGALQASGTVWASHRFASQLKTPLRPSGEVWDRVTAIVVGLSGLYLIAQILRYVLQNLI